MEQAFDLLQYKELSESFDFISECLLAYPDRLHAVPGKDREITVDVVTKKKAGDKHLVQEVMFDDANILWIDDNDVPGSGGEVPGYQAISIDRFEQWLSEEMIVPARLLKVTYTFDRSSNPRLLLPEGGTTRKHQPQPGVRMR